MPRWRHDGAELFYRGPDGRLMAVPVQVAPGSASFVHGAAQPLPVSIPLSGAGGPRFTYQPSPDGQRFWLALPAQSGAKPLTLILNWQQSYRGKR